MADSATSAGAEPSAARPLRSGADGPFDGIALGLLAVALALRPLAGGLVPTEPETAFLGVGVWLAALARGAGLLRAPPPAFGRALAGGALLLLPAWLGVLTAFRTGAEQPALDLAWSWTADGLLLLLLVDLGRSAPRRRLLVSVLLAGVAAAALYALYERFYGMPYFRKLPEGALREGGALADLWNARLRTLRVSGPFGYANALAAFAVLFLPPVLGFGATPPGKDAAPRARRGMQALCLALTVAAVLSGSKAGLLALAAVTAGTLVLLLPCGARTGRAILGLLGAWALVLGGLVAGWALLRGAGGLLADCGLGAGWGAGALVLARRARGGRTAPAGLGLAVTGLLLLGGAGLLADAARGGPVGRRVRESFSAGGLRAEPGDWQEATRAERAARMTAAPSPLYSLVVRLQYWQAALRLIRERPGLGVGLDNFGRHYPRVRPPGAWAVQRAHNAPLQLAADGGLPLLLGWGAFWGLMLLPPFGRRGGGNRNEAPRPAPEPVRAPEGPGEQRLRRIATGAGLAAFAMIYLFRVYGLFGGLSIEFVLKELLGNAASGSVRARTGSLLPLLVHGGVHLVLLPLAWVGACRAALGLSRTERPPAWGAWLALGAGGVLLHALADFVTYMPSLHTLLLAAAGLSLAARHAGAPPPPTAEGPAEAPLRRRSRLFALAVPAALLAGILFGALPHLRGVLARHVAESAVMTARQEGLAAEEETLTVAEEATARAIRLRPGDPALHRLGAELAEQTLLRDAARRLRRPPRSGAALRRAAADAVRRGGPEAARLAARILEGWQAVTEADPVAAQGWAERAEARLRFFPRGDAEALAEAREAAEAAVRRAPHRAAYRLLLAEVLLALGEEAAAARLALSALEADARATDPQAMLPWEAFVRARRFAAGAGRRAPPETG